MPSQPIDLLVNMLNDTSLDVTWKRPLYAGGKLKKYIIFYRPKNEHGQKWSTEELTDDLKNVSMTAAIDKLDKDAKYHVKVSRLYDYYCIFVYLKGLLYLC